MAINWKDFARAVTFRLEWERLCERGVLIDEKALHRVVAEYMQATSTLKIVPEHDHLDLSGDKKLDIAAYGPQMASIQIALEAKWIKQDGGVRDWHREVAKDIFRVERLETKLAQQAERIILVSGIADNIQKEFTAKQKNLGGGIGRVPWIDALLPTSTAQGKKTIKVQKCAPAFQGFFREVARELGTVDANKQPVPLDVPISYQARMIADFVAVPNDPKCIMTSIWQIGRSQNRQVFTP